ncbi:PP2C family serine/threonine-protein phosphatase [Bacillus sp. FJAT-45350]|uniref:PP2C family serine/threonine-protein phosphatase n=1 Tax=Bacillus sp. FJAT-45350 TaxID=2011014 RepID=UPI000BB98788|nr:PP2C family serine/threonine-protein phosphatase [Bacillus sp. FJAT-45350]
MITYTENQTIKVAAYQQAKKGNDCNGDTYFFLETDQYFICAMADGLGSGEGAQCASAKAIETIENNHHLSVKEIVVLCNKALFQSRGAVLTVIKVDYEKRTVSYSNVGNITFILYPPCGKVVRPVPVRGFLSGKKVRVKEEIFPYISGSVILMYSDGINFSSIKPVVDSYVDNPKYAVEQIVDNVDTSNDDVTFLFATL